MKNNFISVEITKGEDGQFYRRARVKNIGQREFKRLQKLRKGLRKRARGERHLFLTLSDVPRRINGNKLGLRRRKQLAAVEV